MAGTNVSQYSNEVNRRSAFGNQSLCNEIVLSNYVRNTQSKRVASIWFEIWGSWIQVKKNEFFRLIFDKFRFFHEISHKKLDFRGKFLKNFDFLGNFTKNFKIGH